MIDIIWTSDALHDIRRLYDFLTTENEIAADRAVQKLVRAPERLRSLPRLGERVPEFDVLEIRRLIVERYEIRCEIQTRVIRILRIWHTRERRLS